METFTYLDDNGPTDSILPMLQFPKSGKNRTSTADGKNMMEANTSILVLFAVILSVCVLTNARIIYVMLVNTNRNNRYVNLLVAQFSTIIFLYCDAFLVRTFDKQLVNLFPLTGTGFCESLTFFQNVMNGAFPLNAVALVYERMRATNKPFTKLHLIQSSSAIWLLTVVLNSPSIFMVKFTKTCNTKFEHCKETLLMKSQDVTLVYEWTRFFVFYVAVSLYMAYVIYQIWGNIRSSHVLHGNRFRNWKFWPKRMQLGFLQSVLFLLIWLPLGTIVFIVQVLLILEQVKTVHRPSFLLLLETCSTFTLLIACPLLNVLLNGDVGPFSLLPHNVLEAICREDPLTVENVSTITTDGIEDYWKIIPAPVATRNEGNGVNIAMNMLGFDSGPGRGDIGISPITAMTYNFNENFTLPTCVDCEKEGRQQKTVSWQE